MSAPETNYRAWLRKANNDLLNIENNLATGRVPWDTVCFHAQQAAEKLLKGFLVFHGHQPQRTHNLVAVLAACVELEPSLAPLAEDCRRLTAYAVETRYPMALFDPDEAEGRAMVAAAHRVRAAVLERVPRPE